MKATNKELLRVLFKATSDLMENKITSDDAKAISSIAKQVNNSFRYEIDKAKLEMKLVTFNMDNKANIELRDIES